MQGSSLGRFHRLMRWSWKLFILSLSLIFILSTASIFGLLYLRSQPLPPAQLMETTAIYDVNGQLLDQVFQGENRTSVLLEDIPPHVKQAFISVEDRHYYQHYGFDPLRIGSAMLTNIQERSLRQGASTITQQLARNMYLTHEKTWQRKWKEAMYTIQLEMQMSKNDILEHYLNEIYFGHSAYGIQSAARMYFGKDVSDLTLAESALIAGIPRGPAYYSPWNNLDAAKARQELILRLMHEEGYISNEDRQRAALEPLEYIYQEEYQLKHQGAAAYFRDYIRSIVTRQLDIGSDQFDHGGLKIYTTLDKGMQQVAEDVMLNWLPDDRPLQGSLLAVDPRTGMVKAMIGGRDYIQSQYNRVFADRHPGSSLKPFLYYTALENGLTPMTQMMSEPTTFTYDDGRASYTPRNFNDVYADDYITMDDALAKSDNIYAVKTIQFVGESRYIDMLHRFGFSNDFRSLPSLALGAQSVNLHEMVYGYATLANQGYRAQPMSIIKIEDRMGNVLMEAEPTAQPVSNPAKTFVLNQMLQSVFDPGGTGHRLVNQLNRPVWGKTGSTNTDSWMLGFTPQLTAGVWVGYDEGQLINHNNDGRLAGQIWADFMEQALIDEGPILYAVPEGVEEAYVNPSSGLLATEHCPIKKLVYFTRGTKPSEYCEEHLPELEEDVPELEDDVPEDSSWLLDLKEWFS